MPTVLSPEAEADIESVLKQLLDDNWFEAGNDGFDVARAMLTGAHLGTGNPDKVSQASGLNRDKVREWFSNLRTSKVIQTGKNGKSTGTWCVGWFDEHGLMAFTLDILCAQGLLIRVEEDSPPT